MTQPEKAPPAKNAKKRKKDEKPARSDITALVRRGTRAYYHRVLPGAVGGDRLYRALEAAWSSDVAKKRAGALNTLYDRGDWNALRRWAAGDMHISVVQRVVLDGAWDELREIYVDDDLLGPAIADHMKRIAATQAEGTRSSHGTVTNALLEEFGPERAMSPITRDEAEAFLHKPRVKGKGGALKPWAPRTQRLARTIAGSLWKYVIERQADAAEKKKLLPRLRKNPWRTQVLPHGVVAAAKIRKPRKKRPAVIDGREMTALFAHPAVRGTPKAALLGGAGYGGLRQQEVANLRMEDCFLDGPKPFLRVTSREGEYEWETKTERSERDVPIPRQLVEIIRLHIKSGFAGTRYLIRGLGKDQPISSTTSDRWTEEAFTAAGLKYGRKGEALTLHSLRHSHATILLSQGISIAAVAERLGDTQEVIVSTYSHCLPNDRTRAVALLEQMGVEGAVIPLRRRAK